ncbi:hypothetical protein LUZ60_003268 [Juncus effusus]|nr:hypothetical protein LUZ60_003268 [Juncus effusus]
MGEQNETRTKFLVLYDRLKDELLHDSAVEFTEEMRQNLEERIYASKPTQLLLITKTTFLHLPVSPLLLYPCFQQQLSIFLLDYLSLSLSLSQFLLHENRSIDAMVSELELEETRERFLGMYDRLKQELLEDPVFDLMEEAKRHVEQMLDYNVRGGKLNRGISVIQTYKLLKDGEEISDEEFFLAGVLGWSIEWLQACLLVLDDIMDNSTTRRGQLCWYKLPKVGTGAINDGVFLKGSIHKMVKRYFREKPYYVDLLELSDEIALQTSFGQMLDLIVSHESERNLSKYNLTAYRRIVQYKTSYYSFYLPVACALLLYGEKIENSIDVKNILVEMGIFFQIQDDYLDCFGDPEVTGKIGTDIEDHKCSWLIVQAIERANEDQLKILNDNYGKSDPNCVKKVKTVYEELDLENVYFDYELSSYTDLISSIEAQPNPAIQGVLKSFLNKIYRRKK